MQHSRLLSRSSRSNGLRGALPCAPCSMQFKKVVGHMQPGNRESPYVVITVNPTHRRCDRAFDHPSGDGARPEQFHAASALLPAAFGRRPWRDGEATGRQVSSANASDPDDRRRASWHLENPDGALSEAEYRKVVQDSGFAGSIVVATDLATIRLPAN